MATYVRVLGKQLFPAKGRVESKDLDKWQPQTYTNYRSSQAMSSSHGQGFAHIGYLLMGGLIVSAVPVCELVTETTLNRSLSI